MVKIAERFLPFAPFSRRKWLYRIHVRFSQLDASLRPIITMETNLEFIAPSALHPPRISYAAQSAA